MWKKSSFQNIYNSNLWKEILFFFFNFLGVILSFHFPDSMFSEITFSFTQSFLEFSPKTLFLCIQFTDETKIKHQNNLLKILKKLLKDSFCSERTSVKFWIKMKFQSYCSSLFFLSLSLFSVGRTTYEQKSVTSLFSQVWDFSLCDYILLPEELFLLIFVQASCVV